MILWAYLAWKEKWHFLWFHEHFCLDFFSFFLFFKSGDTWLDTWLDTLTLCLSLTVRFLPSGSGFLQFLSFYSFSSFLALRHVIFKSDEAFRAKCIIYCRIVIVVVIVIDIIVHSRSSLLLVFFIFVFVAMHRRCYVVIDGVALLLQFKNQQTDKQQQQQHNALISHLFNVWWLQGESFHDTFIVWT